MRFTRFAVSSLCVAASVSHLGAAHLEPSDSGPLVTSSPFPRARLQEPVMVQTLPNAVATPRPAASSPHISNSARSFGPASANPTTGNVLSGDLKAMEVRAALPVDRAAGETGFNQAVLDAVAKMPSGGAYATSSKATANFGRAIHISSQGMLTLDPEVSKPSFCSSATYLVFLKIVEGEQSKGRLVLDAGAASALAFKHQEDGTGVWGRWNANGPGTACLFRELGLGMNFEDIQKAQPGDFLKIWWTEEIGSKERGHSVVYLGSSTNAEGQPTLKFWSSNIPNGYGEKQVPLSSVKHILFSRLRDLGALRDVQKMQPNNDYLAAMKERCTDWKEVCEMVDLRSSPKGVQKSSHEDAKRLSP